ncbi:hypothetical protein HMPREF1171_02037 [Aeromonas dhakensis]|uniref:Uncharacterized protein n=2 Tax=Aeromonas dhakensis TaxID=196024 RepID=K1JC20_9GAMM|nr:hypothetical protein HMPREF1171_02037 [Aeromonas dhakensis]CAB5680580.1 Uncharacterised protein [Aeromonas hydrophila]
MERLSRWWWHRYSQLQWRVDRLTVTTERYPGWRPRVIVARSLCLYYCWDLNSVPLSRRPKALQQQVSLHSPFLSPGYQVRWKRGMAQTWIWDQERLQPRLPPHFQSSIIPESLLSPAAEDGDRWLQGIDGCEWQRWRDGVLVESRLSECHDDTAITCDYTRRLPLQGAERTWLVMCAAAAVAMLLLAGLMLQGGMALRHWQALTQLEQQLSAQDESAVMEQQARLRAERLRQRLLAQRAWLQQENTPLLNRILGQMPATVSSLQQLTIQPGRIEMTLNDSQPDPRGYVTRFDGLQAGAMVLRNVQIQLNSNGQGVRFIAEIDRVTPAGRTRS